MSNKNKKFNINDYIDDCKEQLNSLSKEDKNKINEFANKFIESENNKKQTKDSEDIDFEAIRWKNGVFYPWCKSKQYWLNGWSKEIRLYKCKNNGCKKTFSFMSNSFLSDSNLSLHKWSIYIKCFIQKLTCKQAAVMTDIHLITAWKNRHKILKWLIELVSETKLNGDVILDEFFIAEAYKGRWSAKNKPARLIERQKFYETHEKLRGLSRFKVCIMTGINEKNDLFFKNTGKFGKLSTKTTFEVLNEVLGEFKQITTDKQQSYAKYAPAKKIKHIAVKAGSKKAKILLNRIDNLHYNCRKFLKKFYGVNYYYISRYLTWFKFFKINDTDFPIQKTSLLEQLLIF